jgi:hypothetical protein
MHAMQAIHGTLDAIAETCRLLEELELAWLTAESRAMLNAQLAAIVRVNPLLRRVRLRGPMVEKGAAGVADKAIIAFAHRCPSLTHVTVSGNKGVTDTGLTALAQGCPWLRAIKLGSTVVTIVGMRALAAHCRHLDTLCVAHKSLIAEVKAAQVFRRRVKVSDN